MANRGDEWQARDGELREVAGSRVTIRALDTPFSMRSILLSIMLAGCADEPSVSEASSPISLSAHQVSRTSAQSARALAPTSQWTCFLRGVSGHLEGALSGWGFSFATTTVYPHDGMWWVEASSGGHGINQAHAICVDVPYNPNLEFEWSSSGDGGSVPWRANRHCFLRTLQLNVGLDAADTQISITEPHHGTFTMESSHLDPSTVSSYAVATCFDLDPDASHEWAFVAAGPNSHDPSVVSTTTGVRPSYDATACGLTSIGGDWRHTDDGLAPGVVASANNTGAGWKVVATRGKFAGIHCIH